MRREGRLHGHETTKEFERVLTHNKPTNRSKFTGKCRRTQCRHCRYEPTDRSMKKIKGQRKAVSMDVTCNQRLKDWAVSRHVHMIVGHDLERAESEASDDENDNVFEEEDSAHASEDCSSQQQFGEEVMNEIGVIHLEDETAGEWHEVNFPETCSESGSDEDWCIC